MYNTWLTSDHHFDHTNIIKYTDRPFRTAHEMNEELIARWNQVIQPGDSVYHLGDFCLGHIETAEYFFNRLNGWIYVIPGGHDQRWLKGIQDRVVLSGGGTKRVLILEPLVTIKLKQFTLNERSVVLTLCHYPLRSWEQSHHGMPHVHGHVHNTWGRITSSSDVKLPPGLTQGKSMDIGVDAWDFFPVNLEKTISLLVDS